jgi:hypothetical protein
MVNLANSRYHPIESSIDDWRKIQTVVVILSSSRGGSSVFYQALTQNSQICSLDGEVEPYYVLTGNCYPYNESDGFQEVRNLNLLRQYLFDELMTTEYSERWRKRFILQFPDMLLDTKKLRTYQDVADFLTDNNLAGYFDGSKKRNPYLRSWKIEEPPFVKAKPARPLANVLVLKSVSDAYRIGIHQQLFPWATIRYLHLTRNAASSINGLIDGWLTDFGFHSHFINERWWKFDLPPHWNSWFDAPIGERCAFQWRSAHEHILSQSIDSFRVDFEQFIKNPQNTMEKICRWLDIKPHDFDLPLTMTTIPPISYRWRSRAEIIRQLMKRPEINRIMRELGYSMDEQTWE